MYLYFNKQVSIINKYHSFIIIIITMKMLQCMMYVIMKNIITL